MPSHINNLSLAVNVEKITLILLLLTTLATMVIAIFNYVAVRAMKKQTESTILLSSLQVYLNIRNRRAESIDKKSIVLAQEYYRELFDLHWSEYRLYIAGQIKKSEMELWLCARAKNYNNDKIEICDSKGSKHTVAYKDVWDKLTNEGYFSSSDKFVQFMNLVHENKIDAALRCKP